MAALARSRSLVGNCTRFTVDTSPTGSPRALVSTSCCKKPSARTMEPMGISSKHPATPALSTRSG